jgi:hypothetical protein
MSIIGLEESRIRIANAVVVTLVLEKIRYL